MRSFTPPGDVRDVVAPVPENHILGVASGSSFVLGPSYQGIGSGQLPQALPGQPHDGSPPVSSNPQAADEINQSAVVASTPLASATASGSQQVATSVEPVSALPSGSSSAQVSPLPCPTCSFYMV